MVGVTPDVDVLEADLDGVMEAGEFRCGTRNELPGFAVVDSATGKVLGGPEIHARGFAEDSAVFEGIKPDVTAALEEAVRTGTVDAHQLQQVMRRVVGRLVSNRLRRRPMIVPIVVEA